MAADARVYVLRQLGFVVASWREDPRTDVELLTRFVQTRDEQAFSCLVGRYSELVWGVCRRVLVNSADAEDALQATFLRLARDASRIVNRQALASWLFQTARGCAVDLRRMIDRQRRIEERLATVVDRAGGEAPPTNLRMLLDDELAQLPERDRAVLILCCLEGRTYADVALELRCSVAAVHRRLVRAQTHLRRRLARHGPAASAVFAGGTVLLATGDTSAASPVALARTVEAGIQVAWAGRLPATRPGAVAEAMTTHWPAAATMVAAVGLVAVLVGGLLAGGIGRTGPASPESPNVVALPTTSTRVVVSGVIRGSDGSPVPGAAVAALARRPFGPGQRGLRDEVLAVTTTAPDGRFDLRPHGDFATWFADRVITVQASAPGFAPVTLPVRLKNATTAEPVELRLAAAVPLRGRLIGPDGRAAVGVAVEVVRVGDVVAEPVIGSPSRERPPGWPEPVASGADGTFSLPTLGGATNVWVRVADPRFALDTFRVDRPDGPADYRLDDARMLMVEVRAADTGESLPGARVTLITDRIQSHPHFCATEYGILGPRTVPADIDAVADAHGVVRVPVARGDRVELLVHAPDREPFVGVRTVVHVEDDPASRSPVVRLPRGCWATGIVTDSTGKPIAGAAVHWGREDAAKPEWRDTVLVGRDAITRTDPDGAFRLAVLPGACSLRLYGPTLDYAPLAARVPGTTDTTLFAHHHVRLDVPANRAVPPVRVALDAVKSVSGRVEQVAKTEATFLLASGRVSPVRPYAALPLPVRDGTFTVPGCRSGHVTRAYFLDPVSRVGCVIDVTQDGPVPVAKLAPCGQLRVRVVDRDGRPVAGQDVAVSLLLDRDRPVSETEPVADGQPAEWFDPVNYLTRPKTNANGVAELPALIPGARYAVTVGVGTAKRTAGRFTVEAGKTHTIPDVVYPEPGGSR